MPLDPKAALQVVVSRLRAALGPYGSRIVAEPGGYRLDAGPEEVDFLRPSRSWATAAWHSPSNEGARAADAFDRALSLWTGDALQDLEDFSFSVRAAQQLHDLRVMLVEGAQRRVSDGWPPPGGARRHRFVGGVGAASASTSRAQQIARPVPRRASRPRRCERAKPCARRCVTSSGSSPRPRYKASNVGSWIRIPAWSRPTPGS